ncbi:MAG: DUF4249 domain-containing protein [Marinoscillum sp.]
MFKEKKQLVFILLAFLVACIKPYDFDPQNFDKVLVVDGHISDELGPHTVSINYTYPLDTVLNEYINNAQVWIEVGDGSRVDLNPTENGTYETAAAFRGVPNQTYQLNILLQNGEEYRSEPELLLKAPEVADIYGRYTSLPNANEDRNVGGIQFFIDSEENSEVKYFRYEYEEAFKIQTPYPALYKFVPEDTSLILLDTLIGICYKEGKSNQLIYGTTNGTSEQKMVEFPIRFVSEEDQLLRTRYALLVKQYAISESAYLFYKRLNENNESGGSLFDQQAGTVLGNIYAPNDPDRAILGYFEASGVSTKRKFFSRRELSDQLTIARFPYQCNSVEATVTTLDSAAYYLEITDGNIYYYDFFTNEIAIHSRGCTDCSFYADPIPPSYWEN